MTGYGLWDQARSHEEFKQWIVQYERRNTLLLVAGVALIVGVILAEALA